MFWKKSKSGPSNSADVTSIKEENSALSLGPYREATFKEQTVAQSMREISDTKFMAELPAMIKSILERVEKQANLGQYCVVIDFPIPKTSPVIKSVIKSLRDQGFQVEWAYQLLPRVSDIIISWGHA